MGVGRMAMQQPKRTLTHTRMGSSTLTPTPTHTQQKAASKKPMRSSLH